MNPTTTITEKLKTLATRGIAVAVSPTGALQVRPSSLLTAEDRDWFHAHTAAILTHLEVVPTPVPAISGQEPWNGGVALKLMCDADSLVSKFGVDGNHPAVRDAASLVVSAFATRDLETLRFAVAEFAVVVRSVASEPFSGEKAAKRTPK